MISRRKVEAYAKAHNIELVVERWATGVHVHAYAPWGKVFDGSSCSNAGCGNWDRVSEIDWDFVRNELTLIDHDPEYHEAQDDELHDAFRDAIEIERIRSHGSR